MDLKTQKRIWAPQFLAIILLLWALNPGNPYGYYVFLRWACCAIFSYLAFTAATRGHMNWAWWLGGFAVIYNPIFRVHLNREIWTAINIISIGIIGASFFVKLPPPAKDFSQPNQG